MRAFKDYRRIAGLIVFCSAVWLLRDSQGSPLELVLGTVAALVFWYLQGLTIALNSARTILVLIVGLGFAVYGFRDRIPFLRPPALATSGWKNWNLRPGSIAEAKLSHDVALEIDFDHLPLEEERYRKLAEFHETEDGLNYSDLGKQRLNFTLMPEAKSWTEKNISDLPLAEKIGRIKSWWEKDFVYTLAPGLLSEPHPLDQFLFATHKGFCEHFAGSLATLLRLEKIDARIAVGFYGGTWSAWRRKLIYEVADAHAWTEVLDPETHSWFRVDPTKWVSPNENEMKFEHFNIWSLALLGFFFLLAGAAWKVSRRDSHALFFRKLARLENKNNLTSAGLTAAERVKEIVRCRRDREVEINKTLQLYLKIYFQNHTSGDVQKKFRRSLTRW